MRTIRTMMPGLALMRALMLTLMLTLVLAASQARAGEFALTSPDMAEGGPLKQAQLLNGFGCTGGNLSPALTWSDPPAGTRSFAVTVYDPDAPTGSGWWHWVVFDIPADARGLARGAGSGAAPLPAGAVQSRTDFGAPGYGGACPPEGHGEHRYVFTVYALDVDSLGLDPDSSAALVGFHLGGHALGKAVLTARYGR